MFNVLFLAAILAARPANNLAVVDEYDLSLTLRVPAIVDNMQSLGKRIYKTQRLKGTLLATYALDGTASFSVPALTNLDYKIAGKPVVYSVSVSESPVWRSTGNNRSGRFTVATAAFSLVADPSYNVGDDEPDNTLQLTLAGKGRQKGIVSGVAAGRLGCGCTDYGHISPTRRNGPDGPSDEVTDIAACFGTWRVRYRRRLAPAPSTAFPTH